MIPTTLTNSKKEAVVFTFPTLTIRSVEYAVQAGENTKHDFIMIQIREKKSGVCSKDTALLFFM
jgi:hypothetical protein